MTTPAGTAVVAAGATHEGRALSPAQARRQELTRYVPRMAEVLLGRPADADAYARRQVGLAMLAAQKVPALLSCTPESVATALIRVCALGLEVGTTAHLVPFGRDCTLVPDYKGLIELAIRAGHVRNVQAHPVREGDHFVRTLGLAPTLEHIPASDDARGDVVGFYAVAFLKHGAGTFEYMTVNEVEAIRAKAKSGNSDAWKSHPLEMSKKTVIRRLLKRLPQSPQMRQALAIEEADPADLPALVPVSAPAAALPARPLVQGEYGDAVEPARLTRGHEAPQRVVESSPVGVSREAAEADAREANRALGIEDDDDAEAA